MFWPATEKTSPGVNDNVYFARCLCILHRDGRLSLEISLILSFVTAFPA